MVIATYPIKPCLAGWGRKKERNVFNDDEERNQEHDDTFHLLL